MGAVTEDAFCLKWNDFHTSVTSSFAELREESDLLDATVVCEGQTVRAHKLVLSACSGVFRQLFRSSSAALIGNDHQPVILLWDVKADDLRLLFNFMYEGQVNVAQERLSTFLALAERLQVRGLTSTAGDGTVNRSAAVAALNAPTAMKSIVPLVTPTIPVVGAQRRGAGGQRLLNQGHLNKRARLATSLDHRDGEVGGNAVVKQELKVDGEGGTVYEGVATANSLHPGGFQHQATAVSFNPYYESAAAAAGAGAAQSENDAAAAAAAAHGTTNAGFTTDGAPISHPPEGFELQTSLITDKGRQKTSTHKYYN